MGKSGERTEKSDGCSVSVQLGFLGYRILASGFLLRPSLFPLLAPPPPAPNRPTDGGASSAGPTILRMSFEKELESPGMDHP